MIIELSGSDTLAPVEILDRPKSQSQTDTLTITEGQNVLASEETVDNLFISEDFCICGALGRIETDSLTLNEAVFLDFPLTPLTFSLINHHGFTVTAVYEFFDSDPLDLIESKIITNGFDEILDIDLSCCSSIAEGFHSLSELELQGLTELGFHSLGE